MIYKEIEAIYTKKVAEYIAKGYIINTCTMPGHQGEIAKVDFRKGKEVIRVLFTEDSWNTFDTFVILVGRSTETCTNHRYDTIWNNRLEIIERIEFFKVTEGYAAETIEEFKSIINKQYDRRNKRYRANRTVMSDAAKNIVLPFIKRQPRCKSCKVSDIKVEKIIGRYENSYVVTAKGYSYYLNAERRV